MVMYMRVRIGIVQDIIEDESIIGNVLDKIEITIQNESSKVYKKSPHLIGGGLLVVCVHI